MTVYPWGDTMGHVMQQKGKLSAAFLAIASYTSSFSFSAGALTIKKTSPDLSTTVFDHISTDSSGNIVNWDILVSTTSGSIETHNDTNTGEIGDQAACCGAFSTVAYATPGDWTIAPTPLPSALPLFASGLGVLGLLGWRKKRKHVAA